jgi:hypothetical protein
LNIQSFPTPTPEPTYTPTSTPSPTSTPTPTPTTTPTPTPTATPPPLTGYTNGYTILVNDRSDSYPGTGTTWFSLATGTTYNCSLLNGPVWSGGTPGFWTFDGSNDEGEFAAGSFNATTNSCTFGSWFKTTTGATQTMIAMRGRGGSPTNGWSIMISKESNNKRAVQVAATSPGLNSVLVESTTTLVSNTWYNVYGVWDEGNNCKIYVNGVLENTVSFDRTSLRVSTIGWVLARGNFNYTNCSVSEFITYNNILSDAEILSNFNANKSKYGY